LTPAETHVTNLVLRLGPGLVATLALALIHCVCLCVYIYAHSRCQPKSRLKANMQLNNSYKFCAVATNPSARGQTNMRCDAY